MVCRGTPKCSASALIVPSCSYACTTSAASGIRRYWRGGCAATACSASAMTASAAVRRCAAVPLRPRRAVERPVPPPVERVCFALARGCSAASSAGPPGWVTVAVSTRRPTPAGAGVRDTARSSRSKSMTGRSAGARPSPPPRTVSSAMRIWPLDVSIRTVVCAAAGLLSGAMVMTNLVNAISCPRCAAENRCSAVSVPDGGEPGPSGTDAPASYWLPRTVSGARRAARGTSRQHGDGGDDEAFGDQPTAGETGDLPRAQVRAGHQQPGGEPAGGVEVDLRLGEVEETAGQREPRLVDGLLGAEQHPVPVHVRGLPGQNPQPLLLGGQRDHVAYPVRQRLVRLGVDADTGQVT